MEYRKLGRFELGQSLAQGGMGEVVRSVDSSGRPIALKRILPEYQNSPKFRELFVREAEITFELNHPHIVKAFRFDNIGNQLVLALEFLDGVNLKEVLRHFHNRGFQIPLAVTVELMAGVLSGLDYAHRKRDRRGKPLGIVHRDLNPSNLFLTYDGVVKILDFGISKATSNEVHNLTPKGELRGKICYLSPEQIRGEKVDARTDVFACGIVLWELVTGQPLFMKEQDHEVFESIVSGQIKSARLHRADLPLSFEAVIKKALSPSPSDRFQNCSEFMKALRSAARDQIVPGTAQRELGIFVQSIFKKDIDANAEFRAGLLWLMSQIAGKDQEALASIMKIAEENSSSPYVQLNFARILLSTGHRTEALQIIRKLARVDSMEKYSQEILEWLGIRRQPVFPFLPRSNPLNQAVGIIRHRILGPTPGQSAFQAAA